MEHRFDRLDKKLDQLRQDIYKVTVRYETRLAKLETTQKGFVAITAAVLAASVGVLFKTLL
jgi:predicted component of type VI protein secretion system